MIVAVTGHRPNKLGGYRTPNPTFNAVMEGLDRALLELQPERVLLGMALGVDQWMAELCLFNGVPYVAAIPFEGFDSKWPEHSRNNYRRLLAGAVEIVVVCQGEYEPWKMQARNQWMVDHCDRLIAVFDGTPGGTSNCVSYAREVGRPIFSVAYRPPPPVINQDRPIQAVIRPIAAISSIPVEVRVERSPQPTRPRPESEGQRAARRRALEELRRDTGAMEIGLDDLVAVVGEATRQALDNTLGTPEPEPVEEKKVELVRDFSRFVDLDV